jgi:hypothetical protein
MINVEALQKAIVAHSGWKARLITAVSSGRFDVTTDTVKADDQCAFGKWLYSSELTAAEKATEHYRTVKEFHARFHQEAAKVVELATSGQKRKAEEAMVLGSAYNKASHALTEAMVKWRESLR